MLYALLCTDRPDSLQLRLDTRPDHVAFLNDLNEKGHPQDGRPFLNDEGKPMGASSSSRPTARRLPPPSAVRIPMPRPGCSPPSR